jgi:uncharacterized protein (TIGR03545 family)
MKNWIRWSYVAPRVGGVIVVILLVVYGASPLAKWILVGSSQTAIGAKVDLGDLELSLMKGRMTIDTAQFADPGDEFKNLAQFKHAEFDLDMAALTHKRMVIESGVLDGLEFGGVRAESGALPEKLARVVDEASRQRAKAWLNKLATLLDDRIVDNLETVKTARDLGKKWPAEYQVWENRADAFEQRIDTMQELVRVVKSNPAAHVKEIQQIYTETKQMAEEIAFVQTEVGQLKQRIADDSQRINYATLRDRGRLEETLRITALDGGDVAEYLLGDEYAVYAMGAVKWVSWAKTYLDIAGKPPETERSQGRDVLFLGLREHPSFLVKKLGLTGVTDVQGRPAEFVGTLTNLSSAPRLHKHPTVLQLAIRSENPATVKMVWDNRTDEPFQQLTIASKLPGHDNRTLGDEDSLALTYSAAPGKTWFQARFEDGEIQGKLIIQHQSVQLQPLVDARLGGERLRRPLAAGISAVDHIDVVVDLSGPIRRPKVKFDSNVGRELSDSLNDAVKKELADHKERVLQKAKVTAAMEILQLQQIVDKKQAQLEQRLKDQFAKIGDLTGITNLQIPTVSSLPLSDNVREKLKRFDIRGLAR